MQRLIQHAIYGKIPAVYVESDLRAQNQEMCQKCECSKLPLRRIAMRCRGSSPDGLGIDSIDTVEEMVVSMERRSAWRSKFRRSRKRASTCLKHDSRLTSRKAAPRPA